MKSNIFVVQNLEFIYQICASLIALKRKRSVTIAKGSWYLLIYDWLFMVYLFVDNGFFNSISK